MRLLKRGKVKDMYEVDDSTLLFVFSDRVSAFDVILPDKIPRKGEVLCRMSEFWFNYLAVPHHMIKVEPPNRMYVKKLDMIPIEFVVRGYLYGSLYERVMRGEVEVDVEPVLASKLPVLILDPTTKSEIKDRPITVNEIVEKKILSNREYRILKQLSLEIYRKMSKKADEAGFILADLKIEFGRLGDQIFLADSIGPDEFRLWLKETYKPGVRQPSFDKQPVRDWLISVGYKKKLEEARSRGMPPPPPPHLPRDLTEEVSRRYIIAYERITGMKL